MARRRVANGRLDELRAGVARLRDSILNGDGASSPQARHAACEGNADDPAVARYLDLVRRHAYRITDADVQALRDQGLNDDAIFELTLAAAFGAGERRLETGLRLLGREA